MYEDDHLEAAYEERFEVADITEDDYLDEDENCDRCDEPLSGEVAEVYNPNKPDDGSLVVHVSCIPEGYIPA
jgi:hypothetical protein